MPSGSYALYVAILATLATGAAYVPVDADDPEERAELVFGEADVVAVITEQGLVRAQGSSRGWRAGAPLGRDDAWIIFTSGSTGTPKGVAVTHQSAAAFVDAEAQMFLQDKSIGPDDRVLAGLPVAFDARRGDVAGLAARGLPGPAPPLGAAAWTGAVAGVPRYHRGVDRADAGGAVAPEALRWCDC
jgi:non-ribosomal peptide synthetase component F